MASCTKQTKDGRTDTTYVEGVLLSAADRSPIAHGKVLVLSSYHDGSLDAIWYGRGYSLRNTLVTDAQGRFSYSFAHSEDTVYSIAAEADGYFPNSNSGGYPYPHWRATGLASLEKGYRNYYNRPDDEKKFELEQGMIYLPEIRLAPEGWIKFNIENVPAAYSSDLMTLLPENHGGQAVRFNGSSIHSQYLAGPLRAGRYSRILYNVTSQGDFQFHEDSIFLEPQDTVIYELKY